MNKEGVIQFLRALGADMDTMVDPGRGWINCACPIAEWTHAKGHDEHPSFGVSISDDAHSVYYCFGCSNQARSLGWMLHNMFVMSGEYPDLAANVYLKWECFETPVVLCEAEDVWEQECREPAKPLPPEVLKCVPLISGASGFEARRCREFLLGERGVSEWVQGLCRVRYFEELQALAFALTDIHGFAYMFRLRKRKEKWIRTMSPKVAGFPNLKFPSLKHDIGAWFNMFLVDWSSPVMLVEGEIDAMRLMSLGFFNVLASTTTQVTDLQIDSLTADTYILGYDADLAGVHAVRRIAEHLDGRAALLKADWSVVDCKDAGDLPDRDALLAVLANLEPISVDKE